MIDFKIPEDMEEIIEFIIFDLKHGSVRQIDYILQKSVESIIFPELIYRISDEYSLDISSIQTGDLDYGLECKTSKEIWLEKDGEKVKHRIKFFWTPYLQLEKQDNFSLLMIAILLGYENYEIIQI